MAIAISLINWKGGVGKSTLTLHLAAGLAEFHSKRVLLVDLDPQCNLSFLALGLNNYVQKVYKAKPPTRTLKDVFDAYFNRTPVVASDVILQQAVRANASQIYVKVGALLSHQELTLLDMNLAREKRAGRNHQEETRFEIEKLSIIRDVINQVADDYDYVLLDCPPNVNLVTQNAFFASDYYLIPAIPDFLSTVGISLIRQYMDNFNASFKSMIQYAGITVPYVETKFAGIVFNMVDEYGNGPKKGHAEIIENVEHEQGAGAIFEEYVTDGDGISAAAQMNIPVYAVSDLPRSLQNAQKQADYLKAVVHQFVQRVH